jgi:hypothetical protein
VNHVPTDVRQVQQPLNQEHHAVLSSLLPLKATAVYDTYWRFASERQELFFRRYAGVPRPWTNDPILDQFKFTNAYRAADRVSQYLIRNVIYSKRWDTIDLFFRIMLFKLFNKIETWELLTSAFGDISYREYSYRAYERVLSKAFSQGQRIYSAAYIMASAGSAFGFARKHQNHLKLLERMMDDSLPERIADARSMREVFELLRSYPSIGDFLAYQYTIDINYSPITNYSEMDFVVPGPGAIDGIHKCFSNPHELGYVEIIKLVTERQDTEFERLGLTFKSLWGRPLQLIDCQNLFCEVGKYARLAHPDVPGPSGRMKIKQRFLPAQQPIQYYFPPKWRLSGFDSGTM